jgi:hypothetical protein
VERPKVEVPNRELTNPAPQGGQLGAYTPNMDTSHGGTGREDLIIPRVMLLQALTPDISSYFPAVPGDFVDSITKEVIKGTFIPLFAFKYYAKFNATRKMEWGTVDAKDPRVVEGLEWRVDAEGNKKTDATEMLNFLIVLDSDPTTPRILTFKRASLKTGRYFYTRLSLVSAKEQKSCWTHRYILASKETNGAKGVYFTPIVNSPTTKEDSVVSEELQNRCKGMFDSYYPVMHQVADSLKEQANADGIGDEVPL